LDCKANLDFDARFRRREAETLKILKKKSSRTSSERGIAKWTSEKPFGPKGQHYWGEELQTA